MPLKNIRIVLVRPRGAANVGAVARAMKNVGLEDLVLVRPALVRAFWSKAMAVHAEDVLSRVRRCDSLGEAVADCGLIVGTTRRGGLYRAAAEQPRQAASRIITAAGANRVALVFGPEDHGLSNEDLKRCQQLIVIPTDPGYPSLNLAQAVMVCGYELFLAANSTAATPQVLAPAERVEMMFERLQAAFLSIGYLHRDNPDHIMFAFRRLLGRAQMEERDVRILLALARQIEWFGRAGWRKVAAGGSPHADPLPEGEGGEGRLGVSEGKERMQVGEKF
jgi:tRNA/rRNA methyltransferase